MVDSAKIRDSIKSDPVLSGLKAVRNNNIIVIPNGAMAWILVGPDHRKLVPVAATLGAAFLLIIDSLTRTVSESSLPLSIPIALVGAPFFAVLLRRSKEVWTR